ncbi:MAG: hypothetical protein P8017_01365, partial [Deltaproteobacteria bacterium]
WRARLISEEPIETLGDQIPKEPYPGLIAVNQTSDITRAVIPDDLTSPGCTGGQLQRAKPSSPDTHQKNQGDKK